MRWGVANNPAIPSGKKNKKMRVHSLSEEGYSMHIKGVKHVAPLSAFDVASPCRRHSTKPSRQSEYQGDAC